MTSQTIYWICKDCGFKYWRSATAISSLGHECPIRPGQITVVYPPKKELKKPEWIEDAEKWLKKMRQE